MHLCLFASEVAAAIGQNPFRSPVEVLLSVWKRYHQGQNFRQAQIRVSEKTQLPLARLEPQETILEQEIAQHPELCQLLATSQSRLEKEPLVEVLRDCRQQVQRLAPQLTDVPDKAKYLEDQLSRRYGHLREEECLKAHPDIALNNQHFYRTDMGDFMEHSNRVRWSIGGRTDGFQKQQLVEIKNRRSKYLNPIPPYDLIQMSCYMKLVGATECKLIERLPTGEEKETVIVWDEPQWQVGRADMEVFCRMWAKLMHSLAWQDRLLSAQTKEEKRAVFHALKTRVERDV